MTLTAEQQQIRSKGIGSSEVAAVVGLNPWRSAHDVWAKKVGLSKVASQVDEESEAIVRGRIKEPMIVSWYCETTGNKVRYAGRHQITKVHPEHPIIIATPDGLVDPGGGTLECKAPGWRTIEHFGEPGTDEVPKYYIPQAICQQAVFNRRWTDFAVDMGDRLGVYRLHWNKQLFEILVTRCEQFWKDYVLTKTPPPADDTDSCTAFLGKYYPGIEVEELSPADDEIESLMGAYRDLDQQAKGIATELKGIKNRIRERIGTGRGFASTSGRVIWSEVKGKAKIDWKAVAEELGVDEQLIEKHTRIGSSHRRLAAYWAKGER